MVGRVTFSAGPEDLEPLRSADLTECIGIDLGGLRPKREETPNGASQDSQQEG